MGMLCSRAHVRRVPTYGPHFPDNVLREAKATFSERSKGKKVWSRDRVPESTDPGPSGSTHEPGACNTPAADWVIRVQNSTRCLNPANRKQKSHTKEARRFWGEYPAVDGSSLFEERVVDGQHEVIIREYVDRATDPVKLSLAQCLKDTC